MADSQRAATAASQRHSDGVEVLGELWGIWEATVKPELCHREFSSHIVQIITGSSSRVYRRLLEGETEERSHMQDHLQTFVSAMR